MTTAVMNMPVPSAQLATAKTGGAFDKHPEGNEECLPFAPLLGAFLNPVPAKDDTGEMDTGELLQSLKKVLQDVQESEGRPLKSQLQKIDDLLKKIMHALQHKQGGLIKLPTVPSAEFDPEGENGTENVRYNIQLLGLFEQQIHNMLVPSEGQQDSGKRMAPRALLEAVVSTVDRLMQMFSNNSPPIRGETMPQTMKAGKDGMVGKVAASSRQALNSGQAVNSTQVKSSESGAAPGQSTNTEQKQSTGQTASNKSGEVQTLKNIAASVFQRAVQPDGKNEQQERQTVISFGGFQSGPMSRLQQMVIHARQYGSTAEQQQFIHDFQQMLAQSGFKNIGGRQQLTLQLYPRHLGTLNVKLTNKNGQLTATLITSSVAAKNLVDSQLHQLRVAFIGQNLHVDKLQVMMPPGGQQADQTNDHGEPQDDTPDHQKDSERHTDEDNKETETSFTEWFEQIHLIS